MDKYKNVFFILILMTLFSCGSFDRIQNSAGAVSEPPEQVHQDKINQLESDLITIKQSQSDLEAQLSDKEDTIIYLESRVSALTRQVTALEKSSKKAAPVNIKIEYTTPAELYKKARNLLLEENYNSAALLFSKFIDAHPKDSLADNAVYWLAECKYSTREFKEAIDIFKSIETKYPKSEKVPDAMLKTGYSYLSLDDTNRANHFLKKVLKKYPFSPAAEKAQKKLADFE